MFKITNENLSINTIPYPSNAQAIRLTGRQIPAITLVPLANFGANKGFTEVDYPLPDPFLLINYFSYTIPNELNAELSNVGIAGFTQVLEPKEITPNSFFFDENKISVSSSSLQQSDTISISVELSYTIPFSLKIKLPLNSVATSVFVDSSFELTPAVGSPLPGTFTQSGDTLALFGDSFQYEIEPGMSCYVKAILTATMSAPIAKVAFFALNNPVVIPGSPAEGTEFELENGAVITDELSRTFVSDNFASATPDSTVFPPSFLDSVDFAGKSYFPPEDLFSPKPGDFYWESKIAKLFLDTNQYVDINQTVANTDYLSTVGDISFTVWR